MALVAVSVGTGAVVALSIFSNTMGVRTGPCSQQRACVLVAGKRLGESGIAVARASAPWHGGSKRFTLLNRGYA